MQIINPVQLSGEKIMRKYTCRVLRINEEEISIDINGVCLVGFCNTSLCVPVNTELKVELSFYDDVTINQSENKQKCISRDGDTYKYKLYGLLDVESGVLHSTIDFCFEREDLFEYSFLDNCWVEAEVERIDFEFD